MADLKVGDVVRFTSGFAKRFGYLNRPNGEVIEVMGFPEDLVVRVQFTEPIQFSNGGASGSIFRTSQQHFERVLVS